MAKDAGFAKAILLIAVVAILAVTVVSAVYLYLVAGALHAANCSACYGTAPTATAQAISTGVARITVTASGSAYAIPTQAQVYLYVNGSGSTTSTATSNLAATLNQLNATLFPYVDGNASYISTQSYSLQKVYNQSSYIAAESILVTLPNIKNVSSLLGAIAGIPNVYVNNVNAQLSISQITALRSRALTAALSNATSQAQTLAGSAQLIAQNITISSSYLPGPFFSAAVAKLPNGGPTFFNGRSSVVETITVVFAVR